MIRAVGIGPAHRLLVRREGIEPQPAGWESRDPSTSANRFSAGQSRSRVIPIMAGDGPCWVVSKRKRRPKRRLDQRVRKRLGPWMLSRAAVRGAETDPRRAGLAGDVFL